MPLNLEHLGADIKQLGARQHLLKRRIKPDPRDVPQDDWLAVTVDYYS